MTDRPLTILHVSQPVGVGVPQYVAGLVRDQIARGWRVAVASPPEERPLRAAVRAAGGIQFEWRAKREPGFSLGGEIRQLRTAVRALSPDLIHLHSSVAGLAGRLLLRGRLPTVFQPHGWSFNVLDGRLRWAAIAWERMGAGWADEIVCVSEGERQLGKGVGIHARWRVITNGVDLELYSEAGPKDRDRARRRLSLPQHVAIAVCIGRPTTAKGQDMLVETWPAVRAAIPDALLFVVGDGPERERLQRSAGAGVRLVGHREDVEDWLAAADVVAIPSRWEGMSLAMLEAMARGRSVVSTDVPGARETIGARAGIVVQREPDRFAGALIERLMDPTLAAREGVRGRRIVEASHGAQLTFDEVARAYREVLERRTGHSLAGVR